MFTEVDTLIDSRAAFRELLLDQRRSIDRLLDHVDDTSVSLVRLVDLIEAMEQVDERKSQLIRALREQASELRRREEERSVRQFVLRALAYVGAPQPAGFVHEFIWAHERVNVNTRGFGALRRDEARAWRRRPGHRVAYIVPALDPDGHALARWIARSDWPLSRRLVVDGAERLFDLKKLNGLFIARDELPAADVANPYMPLIRRYAPEALDIEQPPIHRDNSEAVWLSVARQAVEAEIASLQKAVELAQTNAVKRLENLSDEQRLWGR